MHELGDQIDVVVVRAHLVQRHDSGMVEPRRRQRLALDSGAPGIAPLTRDDLHRHIALELLVVGPPDDAEAACADPALEAVAPEDWLVATPREPLRRGASGRRTAVLGASHLASTFDPPVAPPAAPRARRRRQP